MEAHRTARQRHCKVRQRAESQGHSRVMNNEAVEELGAAKHRNAKEWRRNVMERRRHAEPSKGNAGRGWVMATRGLVR